MGQKIKDCAPIGAAAQPLQDEKIRMNLRRLRLSLATSLFHPENPSPKFPRASTASMNSANQRHRPCRSPLRALLILAALLLFGALVPAHAADPVIRAYQGRTLYQWDGRYLSQYQGKRLHEWDGRYLSQYQGKRLYEWDGRYLSQYQGKRLYEIDGNGVRAYQGKNLFSWDGPHITRYQSSRFLTVDGVVPLPVLALIAAGML